MLGREMFKSRRGRELWDHYMGVPPKEPVPRPRRMKQPEKPAPIVTDAPIIPEPIGTEPSFEEVFRRTDYTLHDLVKVYEHQGLVGDEQEVLAVSMASVGKIPFVVLGPSRSGKTYITDLVMNMLKGVYRIEFATGASLFSDSGAISNSNIVYFPELQKTWKDADVRDVFKGLLEGRSMRRTITKPGNKGVQEQVIGANASLAATMAYENKRIDDILMESPEMLARLAIITLDPPPEHILKVNSSEAERRYSIDSDVDRETEELYARKHLQEVMDSDVKVINPFADYLKTLLPDTQKSMGYNKHFYDFVEAITKFHANQRLIINRRYIVTELADCHYALGLYYKDFLNISRTLASDDEQQLFDDLPQPDLEECFLHGYSLLKDHENLEPLRKRMNDLPERWYVRQMQNKQITCIDYRTGEQEVLMND